MTIFLNRKERNHYWRMHHKMYGVYQERPEHRPSWVFAHQSSHMIVLNYHRQ